MEFNFTESKDWFTLNLANKVKYLLLKGQFSPNFTSLVKYVKYFINSMESKELFILHSANLLS